MEKEIYVSPDMEIITFEAEDVIATSTPDENEGPLNDDF